MQINTNYKNGQVTQRGSAMMELLVSLLPYLLIMMGAVFFWHLMLGKQELFKYTAAESIMGDDVDGQDFFGNLAGTITVFSGVIYDANSEDTFNIETDVSEDEDEPVLPYDAEGEDFKSAVSRGAYNISSNADGTVDVSLSKYGQRLADRGLISGMVTGESLPADTNLDFDVDPQICRDVSLALGEWISYRGASGSSYSYSLGFGRNQLFMESDDPQYSFRKASGTTISGKEISAYSAFVDDPELRGSYEEPLTDDMQRAFPATTGYTAVNPNVNAGYPSLVNGGSAVGSLFYK